jgi:hypothetical protein
VYNDLKNTFYKNRTVDSIKSLCDALVPKKVVSALERLAKRSALERLECKENIVKNMCE